MTRPVVLSACTVLVVAMSCTSVDRPAREQPDTPAIETNGLVAFGLSGALLPDQEKLPLCLWEEDEPRDDWKALVHAASDSALEIVVESVFHRTDRDPLSIKEDELRIKVPQRVLQRVSKCDELVVGLNYHAVVGLTDGTVVSAYGDLEGLSDRYTLRDDLEIGLDRWHPPSPSERGVMVEVIGPDWGFRVLVPYGTALFLGEHVLIAHDRRSNWGTCEICLTSDVPQDIPRTEGLVESLAENGVSLARRGASPPVIVAAEHERKMYGMDSPETILDIWDLFSVAPHGDRREPDSYRMAAPVHLLWGGQTLLLYTGFDGGRLSVCAATSSTGRHWKKYGRVLEASGGDVRVADSHEDRAFDARYVSKPKVVATGDSLWMCYSGWDGVRPSNYKLGLATSRDGLVWRRKWPLELEFAEPGFVAFAHSDGVFYLWIGDPPEISGGSYGTSPYVRLYTSKDCREWSVGREVELPFGVGVNGGRIVASEEVGLGQLKSGAASTFVLYLLVDEGLSTAFSGDGIEWTEGPTVWLP